jgi:NAD(P)-dependent dehydrogenase (short-subunit alcohol dehydrogenase family)
VELNGKVALVTGASRGIGRATCIELARAGVSVIGVARTVAEGDSRLPGDMTSLKEEIAEFGGEFRPIGADLSKLDEVSGLYDRCQDIFGRIDIMIFNAAVAFSAEGLHMPDSRYRTMETVNLVSHWHLARAAMKRLADGEGGHILSIGSAAGFLSFPGLMAYGITKLALERLTIELAELGRNDGIAANVFRVDIPVDSEGTVAKRGAYDFSEPALTAAEGILWTLQRPDTFTGRVVSLEQLRSAGIVATRAAAPYPGEIPDQLGRRL